MEHIFFIAVVAFCLYCIFNRNSGSSSEIEIEGDDNNVFTSGNKSVIKGKGNTVVQDDGKGNIYVTTDNGTYVNGIRQNKDVSIICVMKQAAQLLGGKILNEVAGYSVDISIQGNTVRFFNPQMTSGILGLTLSYIENDEPLQKTSGCEKEPPLYILLNLIDTAENKELFNDIHKEWTSSHSVAYSQKKKKIQELLKQITPMNIDYNNFKKS